MEIEQAIWQFVSEHKGYELIENYSPQVMEDMKCLGVHMDTEASFIEFFAELTRFFDEKEIDDPDFLLEGASLEETKDGTVVFFPAITCLQKRNGEKTC